MQKAEIVLSMLRQKSGDNPGYLFDRLYRNLFNPDFYVYAYKKPIPHPSKTCFIGKIIEKIRAETFWPQDASKGFSLEDELIKSVLALILEAVFSPSGQKTGQPRLQTLHEIKTTCPSARWAIAGSITGLREGGGKNYKILEGLLSKKIADGRFFELLRRFLKTGHLKCEPNDFAFIHNDNEKPGETALCAVLAGVYLKELDLFMKPCAAINGEKLRYFRHTDKLALFFAVNKNTAQDILEATNNRLKTGFGLELTGALVDISAEKLNFLGYEITKSRPPKEAIRLLMPSGILAEKLRPFQKNNFPASRPERINLPVPRIITWYNAEIAELYDYYSLADDVNKKIGKFKFYHYYSLAKTIACKEKTSVKKTMKKYGVEIEIKNGTGTKKIIGLKTRGGILTYFNDAISTKGIDKTGITR